MRRAVSYSRSGGIWEALDQILHVSSTVSRLSRKLGLAADSRPSASDAGNTHRYLAPQARCERRRVVGFIPFPLQATLVSQMTYQDPPQRSERVVDSGSNPFPFQGWTDTLECLPEARTSGY